MGSGESYSTVVRAMSLLLTIQFVFASVVPGEWVGAGGASASPLCSRIFCGVLFIFFF